MAMMNLGTQSDRHAPETRETEENPGGSGMSETETIPSEMRLLIREFQRIHLEWDKLELDARWRVGA